MKGWWVAGLAQEVEGANRQLSVTSLLRLDSMLKDTLSGTERININSFRLAYKIKEIFQLYLTFAFILHASQVVPLSKQSLHVILDLSA